jgi:hypothetical protein
MLIYGGITARRRFINGTIIKMFDDCEYYDTKFGVTAERRPEIYKNCGEELLGDLWRYFIKRKVWTYIKIDYNQNVYASLKAPTARYGHAGVYIELSRSDEVLAKGELMVRKYLYIYGGFSYLCTTACYDVWRYEIPYVPLSMPPVARWTNAGNHWE